MISCWPWTLGFPLLATHGEKSDGQLILALFKKVFTMPKIGSLKTLENWLAFDDTENMKKEGTMNNFCNDKGLISVSLAGIKNIQGSLCHYVWKFRLNEQMPRKTEFSKTSKIGKR